MSSIAWVHCYTTAVVNSSSSSAAAPSHSSDYFTCVCHERLIWMLCPRLHHTNPLPAFTTGSILSIHDNTNTHIYKSCVSHSESRPISRFASKSRLYVCVQYPSRVQSPSNMTAVYMSLSGIRFVGNSLCERSHGNLLDSRHFCSFFFQQQIPCGSLYCSFSFPLFVAAAV